MYRVKLRKLISSVKHMIKASYVIHIKFPIYLLCKDKFLAKYVNSYFFKNINKYIYLGTFIYLYRNSIVSETTRIAEIADFTNTDTLCARFVWWVARYII